MKYKVIIIQAYKTNIELDLRANVSTKRRTRKLSSDYSYTNVSRS